MSSPFDRHVRYLITPGHLTSSNFHSEKGYLLETIRLAADTGIELVQVRERSLTARMLFEFALEASDIVRGSETRLLVNERFDIATAAGAGGVHLPSTSIPAGHVRPKVPDGFLIGVSCHAIAEVRRAKDGGADFALLGPVFSTPGKVEPLGLNGLSAACASVSPFPVVGIGGIDASNAQKVIDAGGAGFAAIRYLNEFVRIGV